MSTGGQKISTAAGRNITQEFETERNCNPMPGGYERIDSYFGIKNTPFFQTFSRHRTIPFSFNKKLKLKNQNKDRYDFGF